MSRRRRRRSKMTEEDKIADGIVLVLKTRAMWRLLLDPAFEEFSEQEKIASIGAAQLLGGECAEVDAEDGSWRGWREVFESVGREYLLWSCETQRYWDRASSYEPRALAFQCAYRDAVQKRAGIPPLTR